MVVLENTWFNERNEKGIGLCAVRARADMRLARRLNL